MDTTVCFEAEIARKSTLIGDVWGCLNIWVRILVRGPKNDVTTRHFLKRPTFEQACVAQVVEHQAQRWLPGKPAGADISR